MVTFFDQEAGEVDIFSASNFTSVEVDEDNISAALNVTDLRLGTEYQFTIVAYTNVGQGPEESILVSTQPDGKHLFNILY